MSEIRFTLPYPPSVNSYWRHFVDRRGKGRHLISENGRAYQRHIAQLAYTIRPRPIAGPLAIHMDAFPPDRRERDGDNLWKAPLDALVKAGVLSGDSNRVIVEQSLRWHAPSKMARIEVTVTRQEA